MIHKNDRRIMAGRRAAVTVLVQMLQNILESRTSCFGDQNVQHRVLTEERQHVLITRGERKAPKPNTSYATFIWHTTHRHCIQ
jgi:hypothetical protein